MNKVDILRLLEATLACTRFAVMDIKGGMLGAKITRIRRNEATEVHEQLVLMNTGKMSFVA
jgi:hypothetical protein